MSQIRLGIQQRVLPHFRAPLYAAIANRLNGCLEVFTGSVESDEGVVEADGLECGNWQLTTNFRFGWGNQRFYWQEGFTRWIDIYRPDVLAVECNPRIVSNLVGFKKARDLSIPLIGWGMGVMGNADDKGFYGRGMKRYFAQFDAMIAYGTKGASDYAKFGIASENIFIAPNSVSNTEVEILYGEPDQGLRSIKSYREKLDLREVPVVLFLGRLIPEKQVDMLIEAIEKVSEPCELLIVGDGPIRQNLENIAKETSVAVRFFGHLEGRELALVIAMSDIAVLPGLGGLAVQEVMSYGKPVIVGSADGTQWDLVKDGLTGYHLREQTPLELSRLLSKCIASPNRLSEMGEAARKMIQAEHNMNVSVNAVVATLDHVISTVY